MSLLDGDDLAYLRETQGEVRPTIADLFPRTGRQPDGMGGSTHTWAALEDGTPVHVRIVKVNDNSTTDDVPQDLASKYGASDLRKVVCDLVPITPGDLLHDKDRDRWYEMVSEAVPEEWTTALIAWATPTSKRPSL